MEVYSKAEEQENSWFCKVTVFYVVGLIVVFFSFQF